MTGFTKEDLLEIINVYQNYINDFVNVSNEDIDKMYLEIAKKDMTNYMTNNNLKK